MKTTKMAVLTILVAILVMAAPASAYFSSQSIETKAERMVEVADGARERVLDLAAIVEANTTAMNMVITAGLDEQFYGNISLCVPADTLVGGELTTENGTGWEYLYAANQSLLAGEYEKAIDNAQEALTVFRDALRAINNILCDSGVETDQIRDTQVIQEAIERSLDRIAQLRALIADPELLGNLTDAENKLTEAQGLLDAGEIDEAKDALRDANVIISYVCQHLKEVAQELNPSRVRGYLDEACQYRERFRERFGHAWDEQFDVDGFLQVRGYQNEEEFMNQFQEMIENAQGAEDIEDAIQALNDIGRMIRGMDGELTEEVGHYRAQHGQNSAMSNGYGQNVGGGYGQGDSVNSDGQYGGSGFGNMDSGGRP